MHPPLHDPLHDRSVFVTGGTGAFGQAFVRRCLESGARRVVVFSRSESRQAAMKAELGDSRLRYFLGDIRDRDRLTQAMRDVEIVVHAAAQKRIETCQAEPVEAMLTNIVATNKVAQAAVQCGVSKAVFLSTDKAPAATTVYGASKLFAEGLWTGWNTLAAGTPSRFAVTRYGNVIGSTGSVVPLWQSQAAKGEPLTITDARMSRFLMSMAGACDLVCLALGEMQGGEIFIPRIRASSIVALADAVAPHAPVREVGIRGLEKLHETLISEDESRRTYDCGSHYVIAPDDWAVPMCATLVPEGFTYRSDLVPRLSADELTRLVA